jgi:hypothetical protein
MGVAVNIGVRVEVAGMAGIEGTVGVGVMAGARDAVDVDAAVPAPVQPDKVKQQAIQVRKIRSFLILIINSRW